MPCALQPCALRPAPCTLRPAALQPCALHPAALRSVPCALHGEFLSYLAMTEFPSVALKVYTNNHYDVSFRKDLLICKAELERGETELGSSFHWFTPQMATTAGTGPGCSQEPGTSPRFSTCVATPKHLARLPLLSQAQWEGDGSPGMLAPQVAASPAVPQRQPRHVFPGKSL